MNFYKHFIGDYQRDTGHLSLTEHGAYRLMLDAYYGTGKPLPLDRKQLYRLLRCDSNSDRKAVDSIVEQFWFVYEDGLVNERAGKEMGKANVQAEINKQIAVRREAARKEARNDHDSLQDLFNDQSTNRSTNDEPNHSHSHSQIKEKNKHSSDSDVSAGFAEFWQEWPSTDRKTAKAVCAKKWKAKGLDREASVILADVVRQKSDNRSWLEGFEPAPLTYLNQRRWEDGAVGGGSVDPFR